ncbi:MAG: M23 family metallopeptidase [Alphaproteobacteria bacterium]|nr:M23 family metallopeptidase [Alphaproteobacteria bacterium]
MRLGHLIVLALSFFGATDCLAQGRRMGGGGFASQPTDEAQFQDLDPAMVGAFFARRAEYGAMVAKGFLPTGLVPIYPDSVACPRVDSGFAANTRGDGSPRERAFFVGYHGGIDIPVPEGTPVLAVADGTVVHKSPGESIGGIGIILRHAPEATGLPVWTYTEYKHLKTLPEIALETPVRRGEVIAISGKTGTEGPYYGPSGHPHLHLSAWWAPTGEFEARRFVLLPKEGRWLDPLVLFRGPPVIESAALAALPREAKGVAIPHVGPDGRTVPATTRAVWPLACGAR